LDGFGHLVPSKENEPILGVQWNSVTFPQQDSEQPNGMRLTVMARIEDHQRSLDKAQWLDIACKSVAKHLGVSQSPDDYNIAINFNAIPQYPVGHARMVGEIERIVGERLPGLVLAGNSFYGVGINDSVHAAYNAVRAVERSWQS
jgi:oxygen-dependent protoporphyrinogen oxidase